MANLNLKFALLNQKQEIVNFNTKYEEQIKVTFEEEFLNTENVSQLVKVLKYEYNSLFKRLFSSKYKDIFKRNRLLTKELKLSHEQLIKNVEKLLTIKEGDMKIASLNLDIEQYQAKLNQKLNSSFNFTDEVIQKVLSWIQLLVKIKEVTFNNDIWLIPVKEVQRLIEDDNYPDWILLRHRVDVIVEEHNKLSHTTKLFYDLFPEVEKDIDSIVNFINELDFSSSHEFFEYSRFKKELIEKYNLSDFISKLELQAVPAEKIYSVFLKRYLLLVVENYPDYGSISKMTYNEINERIKLFKGYDKKTFGISRDIIFKSLVDRLPRINEGIRIYRGEIGLLKKEIAKKRRLLSTRKLIQSLPNLLPRLKPCIMMSPLTVSTYFSTNPDWKFDLVIFVLI